METLQDVHIISNFGAQLPEVEWLFKELPIERPPTFHTLSKEGLSLAEFRNATESIPTDSLVIYIQSPYFSEDETTLRGLYRNDTHGRKLENALVLHQIGLSCQLNALTRFLNIQLTLAQQLSLEKALKKKEQPRQNIAPTTQFYEDRRHLLNAQTYLSDTAIRALDLREVCKIKIPVFDQEVSTTPASVVTLIDSCIESKKLKELVKPAPPGYPPSYLAVIFSHIDVVRPFLEDPYFTPFLQRGSLQLWHKEEWKEKVLYSCTNPRCCLTLCKDFYGDPDDPLVQEVQTLLRKIEHRYVLATQQSVAESVAYYKSSAFESRLQEIANGSTPRIQIDCACSSVAVKQYSRNIAAALKAIGCDVLIHSPCKGQERDLFIATQLELRKFQPDLIITSPNNLFRHKVFPNIQVPVVIPVQDQEPHIVLPKLLREQPLCRWDMLLLMQERFYEPIIAAGASKDQVYHNFLPAEEPLIEHTVKPEPIVGLVKTMPEKLSLQTLILAKQSSLSNEDLEVCRFIENEVNRKIIENDPLPIDVCTKLAYPRNWGPQILAYYHQKMCFDHAQALVRQKIKPRLFGSNWERMEGLEHYAHGHIKDRTLYQKQFTENQINLSLNPWNEYHPRVLDGGRVGAFFLVHQVPQAIRWQPLPKDLIPGEHFDYFTDLEDLIAKCQYYLKRPELCQEIGSNLRDKIKESYSYERAAKQLLERFIHLIKLTSESHLAP